MPLYNLLFRVCDACKRLLAVYDVVVHLTIAQYQSKTIPMHYPATLIRRASTSSELQRGRLAMRECHHRYVAQVAGWTRLGARLACADMTQRALFNIIFLPMRCRVDLTVLLCSCFNPRQFTNHSHHHLRSARIASDPQCNVQSNGRGFSTMLDQSNLRQAASGCARVCVFSYDGGRAGGPLGSQSTSALTTKTGESDGAPRSMQAPREFSLRVLIRQVTLHLEHGNRRVSTIENVGWNP